MTMANLQPKKCGNRSFPGDDDDDLISQLPDEVLVEILSLLSVKEAARTSVLSPRWMNLWKHTPSLLFDADPSLLGKSDNFYVWEELLKTETPKYVRWVKSVIQSHESLALKEFRIRFPLNDSSRKAITGWLRFAFSRRVQRLVLDLKSYYHISNSYIFPDELLTLSGSSDSVCIGHRIFKSLKALVLKYVSLSDGAIESVLHNCPLLEQLTVRYSEKSIISKVEVCGSSLKLKHLEIVGAPCLKSIKVVSVPRLTTLIVVSSYKKTLLIENVPMLVNVSIRCLDDDISIQHVFNAVLSCCISQLQTLCLMLLTTECNREIRGEIDVPKMPKLKKLVVDYCAIGFENLIRLAPLIRLSPNLEEFELQFKWESERKVREVRAPIRSPHHHLKVFKFCGYYGSANDVELLSYILENCIALEKITIDVDPVDIYVDPVHVREWDLVKSEVEETARKNAKEKLAPQVPQHVQLVIL